MIGLAPTNAVIADLSKDCYARTATVHRELGQIERDPSRWDRKNVVMVDEAGMMDNAIMASRLDARVHEIIRSTLQRMLLWGRYCKRFTLHLHRLLPVDERKRPPDALPRRATGNGPPRARKPVEKLIADFRQKAEALAARRL